MTNGSQDDPKGGAGDQKIKVGEKEYSADDVQNLLTRISSDSDKAQAAQRILDVAAKFDMNPEEFAQQSVGALNVINDLITKGVIDTSGKLVEKKEGKPGGPSDDDPLKDFLGGGGGQPTGEDKVTEIVSKALGSFQEKMTKQIGEIGTKIKGLEDLQSSMIRKDYQKDIQDKYPNLDGDDVSKVFGAAMKDDSKTLWEHAKEASEAKQVKEVEIAKKWAADHGFDYDQVVKDANDLKEMGPEGGGAAAIVGERKISFRRKGEGYVSPLEATQQFFKKKGM